MPRLPKLSRRQFLYGGAAAAAIAAAGLDGFIQSDRPRLVKLELPLARLPRSFDGFTIAQLSDFHYESRFSVVPIRKAVEMTNALAADLIVLTGDFVTVPMLESYSSLKRAAETADPCADILRELRARMGTFAILGNHDCMSDPYRITRALEDRGMAVLRNRSVPLERGAGRIWLAGMDDALQGSPDLSSALQRVPQGEMTVLLAHEPDVAEETAKAPVDLQLSGHSHGGQIWLPGIGAPWLPPLARKYPRGLRRIGRLTLYTNVGIGTIRAPIRINCPPEVTLFTLRSAQA